MWKYIGKSFSFLFLFFFFLVLVLRQCETTISMLQPPLVIVTCCNWRHDVMTAASLITHNRHVNVVTHVTHPGFDRRSSKFISLLCRLLQSLGLCGYTIVGCVASFQAFDLKDVRNTITSKRMKWPDSSVSVSREVKPDSSSWLNPVALHCTDSRRSYYQGLHNRHLWYRSWRHVTWCVCFGDVMTLCVFLRVSRPGACNFAARYKPLLQLQLSLLSYW